MKKLRTTAVLLLSAIALTACTKEEPKSAPEKAQEAVEEAADAAADAIDEAAEAVDEHAGHDH